MSGPRLLGLGRSRQRSESVDLVEGQFKALPLRHANETLGHLGRNGLPSLVVADVSLGASELDGKGLLGHAEEFSDGLDEVHAAIVVPLLRLVNSATVLMAAIVRLLLRL